MRAYKRSACGGLVGILSVGGGRAEGRGTGRVVSNEGRCSTTTVLSHGHMVDPYDTPGACIISSSFIIILKIRKSLYVKPGRPWHECFERWASCTCPYMRKLRWLLNLWPILFLRSSCSPPQKDAPGLPHIPLSLGCVSGSFSMLASAQLSPHLRGDRPM